MISNQQILVQNACVTIERGSGWVGRQQAWLFAKWTFPEIVKSESLSFIAFNYSYKQFSFQKTEKDRGNWDLALDVFNWPATDRQTALSRIIRNTYKILKWH